MGQAWTTPEGALFFTPGGPQLRAQPGPVLLAHHQVGLIAGLIRLLSPRPAHLKPCDRYGACEGLLAWVKASKPEA